jgi:tetratricopeptide (TPR) repeat protein
MRQTLIASTCFLALVTGAWAQPAPALTEMLAKAEKLVSEKRLDEALEQYKTVFGQDERSTTALFNIGWIYNEQRKYDSASRWLKKGAQIDPQDAKIQHELGFAYAKLDNAGACIDAYSKACQLKPDRAASWVGLGDAQYEMKKDYSAAASAYLKAVEAGANSAATLYRLGWCQNHLNQFDKAQANLKKAADLEPKSAAIWLEWGYALLRNQQPSEAVQALTRANLLDPKQRLGHLYLGRAYLKLGNKKQALRQVDELRGLHLETARQLDAEIRQGSAP